MKQDDFVWGGQNFSWVTVGTEKRILLGVGSILLVMGCLGILKKRSTLKNLLGDLLEAGFNIVG